MNTKHRDPLGRALQIISRMSDEPKRAWGVREIARELDMSHSTTHRILGLLEAEGFVTQDPENGSYQLGLELYRLARRVISTHPIWNAARPILEDLVEECNETALLGLYDSNRRQMLFAASVESTHPLRYVIETNRWLPVYAGATGLAILAFLPEAEQQAIIQQAATDRPPTAHTLSDPQSLLRAIQSIREKGYAITQGQRIEGAVGVAAPIWGPRGDVVGDVALTLPDQRFTSDREQNLASAVLRAAERVTHQLGGTRPRAFGQDSSKGDEARSTVDLPIRT